MVKSSSATHISANADSQQSDGVSGFSARLQQAAQKKGLSQSDLSRITGLKSARIHEYWHGPKMPTAQNLFAIARALGASAEWLSLGRGPVSHHLVDSGEADWVSLPEYDLRAITAGGKGDPLSSTVFRRDWLNRTLLTDTNLWTTRLISGYPPSDLDEGEQVIVQDMALSELAEGHLCIWGMDLMGELTGRLVGRYSMRAFNKGLLDDGDGGILIDPGLVGPDEHGHGGPDRYFLIGRILGRPLAAIR